ncbi:TPA: ead/Ea22-like family protein [Escherichia coli]|nr:ead/Ea22-like family protein [Escherichia coli]
MSNIDKIALREAAEKATPDDWKYSTFDCAITDDTSSLAIVRMDSGHLNDEQSALNGAFIAAANPATVLALLDELEAKDNRINRLEAIVAVAEQRNALMREWKRALKVPCDLVDDQVPVVIHGMVIRLGRLKETEAKLEAAEKRIAELEAREVKLPDSKSVRFWPGDAFEFDSLGYQIAVETAIKSSGIKFIVDATKGE